MAKEIRIDFRELATLIARENRVTEGHWGIWVRFGLGAANVGPDAENLAPAAVVPIQEIGIQRFDEPNNMTVDAAKIWGARAPRTKSTKRAPARRPAAKAKPRTTR